MTMSILHMVDLAASVIAAVVAFLTVRAGSGQAREFRALTGDDSLIVSIAALGRSPLLPKADPSQSRCAASEVALETNETHAHKDELIPAE